MSRSIARDVLTSRLSALVGGRGVRAGPHQDRPTRHAYHLTAAGAQLFTPLLGLMQWGDEHRPAAGGPPRTARHRGCGGSLVATQTCTICARPVGVEEVEMVAGTFARPSGGDGSRPAPARRRSALGSVPAEAGRPHGG